MSTPPVRLAKPTQIRQALKIYRVMAIVAGLALFILVAIIIINRGFGKGGASAVWSPIHGFIYMGYVVSIVNLGFKSKWSLVRIILNMLSGFVPFVPFIAERRVTKDTEALLLKASGTGLAPPAAPGETPAAG